MLACWSPDWGACGIGEGWAGGVEVAGGREGEGVVVGSVGGVGM